MEEKEEFDGFANALGRNTKDRRRMTAHRSFSTCRHVLRKNLLFILMIIGIICGFAIGFGVRGHNTSKDVVMWIGMPGELYLRMLKLMILPLLVSSVLSGTASLDPKSNGKISIISFIYINITNVLGCVIAIVLSLLIKPGLSGNTPLEGEVNLRKLSTQDIFADLLRNIIPANMVEATFRQSQTKYVKNEEVVQRNTTNGTFTDTLIYFSKEKGTTDGMNVLGLIFVCTVVGIATGSMKEKGVPFLNFFSSATDVFLKVLRWFLWTTPIGVASLIAASIAVVGDVEDIFHKLGLFVTTVSVGIVLHQFLFLPMILFIFTRRNPFKFIISIYRAILVCATTGSTAVAIPEMFQACEGHSNKLDKRVSRFVIPFAVTLNADGSALYITAAAMFMANITGIDLTFTIILSIGLLSAVASLALPSVPSSSIVTLVMILTSLSIPAQGISLLFSVEWFLDRIRTACNLVSHTFCAAITNDLCRKTLQRLDANRTTPNEEVEMHYSKESKDIL